MVDSDWSTTTSRQRLVVSDWSTARNKIFPCFEKTWRIISTNLVHDLDRLARTSRGWGNEGWTAGAIYLFYLGWLWTGIGDLDGLVGRQPPGVPLDVDAGVHSGLLLRLPCPSSFLAASSSRQRFPEVPRVTPGPLLGPRSYTTNPQFLTWNGREGVSVKIGSHLSGLEANCLPSCVEFRLLSREKRGKGIRDRSHVDKQNMYFFSMIDQWFLLCFQSWN